MLDQLPAIHQEELTNILGCKLCRAAQIVSIIGFSTWVHNNGEDKIDWISRQVNCWQCRRGFYGGLIDAKYKIPANLLIEGHGQQQVRKGTIFDDAEELAKSLVGFNISDDFLLAHALALPMFLSGPWQDFLLNLRQYLTWLELFNTTLADLRRHPIHSRLFETLLNAYDVKTESDSWSFPDLDNPRFVKHEILITPLSNQVAYLACGFERKGARLVNVRWVFAVHFALPPLYCRQASLALEETHINPARLDQTIDKLTEEVRSRFRLSPEWATAITQSCHRIAAAIQLGEP